MRQIGLRVEILFNLLLITAVAMFFIGIISFKVVEGYALRGKVDSTKAVIRSFKSFYSTNRDLNKAVEFLSDVLEPGAWGVVSDSRTRVSFEVGETDKPEHITDPIIMDVIHNGSTVINEEGYSFLPFIYYKGLKYAAPLNTGGGKGSFIYIYQPLGSIKKSILVGHRYIALWIVLDLTIIALFGSYLLSRRIVRPVQQLIKSTEDIAAGKPPAAENLGWVQEINQLYLSLVKMYIEIEMSKRKLRENYDALEQSHTALQAAQNEVILSEKLASLGKVAAGIAHEIGNPLSAIRSYVDALKKGYGDEEWKRDEVLGSIQNEVQRIDKIIRTLLEYSRPKSFEVRNVNIKEMIEDSIDIINSQGVLKNIEINLHMSDECLGANVDRHQFSQVLINLILNARDAMDGTGSITISSGPAEGNGVEIAVRDTGCGISPDTIDKIFDPFFTTKEPGKGTGLGLAVSHRIIESFSGKITVESEQGKGTVFKIVLPGETNNAS